jgi:hypothetical protein
MHALSADDSPQLVDCRRGPPVDDFASPTTAPTPPGAERRKKTRTVFSRGQVVQLESAFVSRRYLSSRDRCRLAAELQLTETQVKIWFQNRRNKWKRQLAVQMETATAVAEAETTTAAWPRRQLHPLMTMIPTLYHQHRQHGSAGSNGHSIRDVDVL